MTTILLVDDRRESLLEAGTKLQNVGFEIRTASDGAEALEAITKGGIDLVFMDMNMPKMDGCEAAEQMKTNPDTASIPVILWTAHPLDGDRERALQSGCDAYLDKAFDVESVMPLMGRLLGSHLLQNTRSVDTDPAARDPSESDSAGRN